MDKELFEGAVVAGKEKIKKLRKKQYLCIFGIVYMVFCMILLPDSLMFAIGLVVIGFAGFKFWKFRKEYNLHKTLLETNEGVLRAINSSEEEEYDDPNVTYSAADLLGTSSDDEDSAGEEDEESDDEEFEFDDEEFEEDDEEIIEYDLGLDDYFKQREEEARKYEEEDDGVKYSAADLLGSSSGETTKKTTKKSKSKKSGK